MPSNINNLKSEYSNFAVIFPRFSGPYGGEKICIKTINQLVKFGYAVDLYTTYLDPASKKVIHPKIKIFEKPRIKIKSHNLANLVAYFTMPALAKNILFNLKNKKYKYIIGQTWQSALALWYLKRRIKKNSTRLIYHCFEPPRFLYDLKNERGLLAKIISPFIRLIDKKAVQKGPDQIIAISDLVQKWIEKIYDKDAQIIYPGVEINHFKQYTKEQARQVLKIPKNQEIFLSISKLHKRKRLKLAMRIFKKKRTQKEAELIMAGTGPEKENLKKYAQKIGIGKNIKFIGQITHNTVVLWNTAADYFIFTAKNEPFGIAPQEAKIAGAKILPKERPYPIWSWKKSVKRFLNSIVDNLI